MWRNNMNTTVTKNELMTLGFGPSQSSDIVRRAKALMVQKGYSYYTSKRLGRVPISAVEEILGMPLNYEREIKVHA